MKIKMLSTQKGSENGYEIKTFYEGNVEIVHDDLAKVFIKEGWAEEFKEKAKPASKAETKELDPVVENKELQPVKKTKAK